MSSFDDTTVTITLNDERMYALYDDEPPAPAPTERATELDTADYTLGADEVTELLSEADLARASRSRELPPPPRARAMPLMAATRRVPLSSSAARSAAPSAPEDARLELDKLRAELNRLSRQLRARDAYLHELERELDESTRQIEAAGVTTFEDAARLLGRVRGQAFRIAELEAELRQTVGAARAH